MATLIGISRALLGNVVEVALGVGLFVIDSRRSNVVLDRLAYGGGLDGSGGAEEVPGHRLRGADGQTVLGMCPENVFQGKSFGTVVVGRRSAVSVYVGDVFGSLSGIVQRQLHTPS